MFLKAKTHVVHTVLYRMQMGGAGGGRGVVLGIKNISAKIFIPQSANIFTSFCQELCPLVEY